MRILLVSATEKEINLVIQNAREVKKTGSYLFSGSYNNLQVDFLIAGIGLPVSIFRLTRQLSCNNYDLVINPGIAGSFKEEYPIGSVVSVASEQFGDLGVDDRGEFKTLFDLGFVDKKYPAIHSWSNYKPLQNKRIKIYLQYTQSKRHYGK